MSNTPSDSVWRVKAFDSQGNCIQSRLYGREHYADERVRRWVQLGYSVTKECAREVQFAPVTVES